MALVVNCWSHPVLISCALRIIRVGADFRPSRVLAVWMLSRIKIFFAYDHDILTQAMPDSVFVTANIPAHKVEVPVTELYTTLAAPFIITKEANILGLIKLVL